MQAWARGGGAAAGAARAAAQLGEGVAAIARSRYLTTLALYLLLSTAASSLLYFLKAAVLAGAAPDAGGRMALVAVLNSVSAVAIALLQVPSKAGRSCPFCSIHTAKVWGALVMRSWHMCADFHVRHAFSSQECCEACQPRSQLLLQPRPLGGRGPRPPYACAQLCATGRLLQRLGLERALCATPLVSAGVLAVVCAVPSAAVVGVGEAARKVRARLARRPPEMRLAPAAPGIRAPPAAGLDALFFHACHCLCVKG